MMIHSTPPPIMCGLAQSKTQPGTVENSCDTVGISSLGDPNGSNLYIMDAGIVHKNNKTYLKAYGQRGNIILIPIEIQK